MWYTSAGFSLHCNAYQHEPASWATAELLAGSRNTVPAKPPVSSTGVTRKDDVSVSSTSGKAENANPQLRVTKASHHQHNSKWNLLDDRAEK